MMDFIGQGFLTLPIEELGPQFHAALYERAQAEFGPKNNGLQGTGGSTERIPELLTMVNSPTVAGALVSLLGPEYAHGHLGVSGCALHVSTEEDQIFHKDTQRAAITGHRTRAVMVMYYPGAADVDMGPTAIVPSSHIMARDGLGLSLGVTEEGPRAEANRDDWSGLLRYPGHEDDADQSLNRAAALQGMAPSLFEHKVVVPHSAAGSICIVHEDMVHRATPHFGGHWRPMFKFSFTRLHEPTSPSWDHDPAAVAPADTWPALAVPEATPICESLWQWHLGSTVPAEPQAAVDVPALAAEVAAPPCDGDEGRRVGAAYALGACGTAPALASLADALCSETNESARRAASHGLGAAGDRAVPTLLTVLATPTLSPLVAGSAIDALGDAAMLPDPAVVQSLAAACATQQAEIDAVEQQAAAAAAAAERDADLLLPAFEAGGMISHVNDSLQVPIMLPIACRPIAARYLVIALAQIALGRLADRWTSESGEAAREHRTAILDALRPWSHNACPRVRKENGRAIFQLCAAVAHAATSAAAAELDSEAAAFASEVAALRGMVDAGAFSVVQEKAVKLPAAEQSLAALERVTAALSGAAATS